MKSIFHTIFYNKKKTKPSNRLFLVFFLLSFWHSSDAQNLQFEWVKSMGGTDMDRGNSIVQDAQGNVYTTGFFEGTADFDPDTSVYNLTAVRFHDIFVQKLGPDGSFQ